MVLELCIPETRLVGVPLKLLCTYILSILIFIRFGTRATTERGAAPHFP